MLALAALGGGVALMQHGAWATVPWLPDPSLALLAWAVIDGDEERVPWRAVLLGLVHDVADPGSQGLHLGTSVLIALAALAARRLLFRARLAAWLVGGLGTFVIATTVDVLLTGPGDRWGWSGVVAGVGTALLAGGWGWLLGGLPDRWRPIPPAGA